MEERKYVVIQLVTCNNVDFSFFFNCLSDRSLMLSLIAFPNLRALISNIKNSIGPKVAAKIAPVNTSFHSFLNDQINESLTFKVIPVFKSVSLRKPGRR